MSVSSKRRVVIQQVLQLARLCVGPLEIFAIPNQIFAYPGTLAKSRVSACSSSSGHLNSGEDDPS